MASDIHNSVSFDTGIKSKYGRLAPTGVTSVEKSKLNSNSGVISETKYTSNINSCSELEWISFFIINNKRIKS